MLQNKDWIEEMNLFSSKKDNKKSREQEHAFFPPPINNLHILKKF